MSIKLLNVSGIYESFSVVIQVWDLLMQKDKNITSTLCQRKGGAPQPSITFSCQAWGKGGPSCGGGGDPPRQRRRRRDSTRPIRLTVALWSVVMLNFAFCLREFQVILKFLRVCVCLFQLLLKNKRIFVFAWQISRKLHSWFRIFRLLHASDKLPLVEIHLAKFESGWSNLHLIRQTWDMADLLKAQKHSNAHVLQPFSSWSLFIVTSSFSEYHVGVVLIVAVMCAGGGFSPQVEHTNQFS